MATPFPSLPLLLYGLPGWLVSPRRVLIYLQEKQIPSSVVTIVPDEDDPLSKAYPKLQGTTIPRLAVPKENVTTAKDDPASYIWLPQSMAIIEYLEDLCDAHPSFSPVPSLRGGGDLVRRLAIRGCMHYADAIFNLSATTLVLGSDAFNESTNQDAVHVPSANAVAALTHSTTLKPLDDLIPMASNFEALKMDKAGGATIADIIVFTNMTFFRDVHGQTLFQGYANLQKLIDAFARRTSANTGIVSGYPGFITKFQTGFRNGVWSGEKSS